MTSPRTKDDALVDRLLEADESLDIEFKREPKVQKLLETVVAMSNANGGTIALGLLDERHAAGRARVVGVSNHHEKLDELRQACRQRIVPPLDAEPSFTTAHPTTTDGGVVEVVLIKIEKGARVHSVQAGGTYERFERSNRQLSAQEILRLAVRRGERDLMSEPVEVDLALLDTEWWRSYSEHRGLTRPLPEAMRHLGLAKTVDNVLLPTRAAVLLFAEEPGGLLHSKTAVRIFQYSGTDAKPTAHTNLIRPPTTVAGPLVSQIRKASELALQALATRVHVSTAGFDVEQRYPPRVIQEAITNAVLHRDYSIDADIQVAIMERAVIVISPGDYPGAVTASNIRMRGSHPRNSELVRHVREFPRPPNLDAGEGVRMMFAEMKAQGLYAPVYLPADGRDEVRVVLLNESQPDVWERVVRFLEENGTIANRDLRKLMGTDDTLAASKRLKDWVDKDLLVVANPKASKSQRRYRLVNAPDPLSSAAEKKARGEE